MQDSTYSPLKIIHHQDKLDQLRRGEPIVPTQVQLIISDLCNQDCHFCAYRMSGNTSNEMFVGDSDLAVIGHNNPKRQIEYAKILEILDDCAEMGVGAIQLTGGGEPTAHPKHTRVFNAVLDREFDLALVTNGLNLNAEDIEILTKAKWVRVSMDAGNAESYGSTRRVNPAQWDQVWKHVSQLVEAKKKADSDLVIGIGFVVTQENYAEVVQCTEIAKEVGVDNIRISAVFGTGGATYFQDFYSAASELCREAKNYESPDFKVFNMFGERVEDLEQRHPDYSYCGYQEFNTYIGGDLNVYRCCVLAYNSAGLVGSIKDQRFKDLWTEEKRKAELATFDAHNCPRCMFNGRNKVILYAIEENPQHVNFV